MNGTRIINLFISQPMRGFSDEEIKRVRKQIVGDALVKAADYYQTSVHDVEIMDTIMDDFDPTKHPLVFLGESIKRLASADVVYFARGWQDARGCVIEHECAQKYGKACIYY